jgi:hypothetical protein
MIDEQRLAELPPYTRMAWSSRPVWDRRPAAVQRRNPRSNLGVARRYRSHSDVGRSSLDDAHALARSKSLVSDLSLKRRETK